MARGWRVLKRPPVAISIGVLLAFGIGAAVFFATRGPDASPTAGPSASPSASSSATPSPSPSPVVSIDANGRALPGFVATDPSLPEALPLPSGIWEKTGPGWVLATYRPSVTVTDDNGDVVSSETTKQVVYLVSPKGERYQALELDVASPIMIDSWSPRETSALVHACDAWGCYFGSGVQMTLDLTTGAMRPVTKPFEHGWVVLTGPDGVRLWAAATEELLGDLYLERDGGFAALDPLWQLTTGFPQLSQTVSPDGTRVGVTYFDASRRYATRAGALSLTTGAVTTFSPLEGDVACSPWHWVGATTLTVWCNDRGDGTDHYFVGDALTGVATPAGAPDYSVFPRVEHNFVAGPGTWAGPFSSTETESMEDYEPTVGIDAGGSVSELVLVDAVGARLEDVWAHEVVESVIYAEGQHESNDVQGVRTVVAYDLASKRQVVLLPAPPGGPTAGSEPEFGSASLTGVTSWAVAR